MAGLGENSGGARRGSPRVWSFAGCVLDERSLELRVQGQAVDLDRKPLEVLIHLLRHAGEVVTKDELAEAVWPGRIITDSNLTKTMAVLRAAIGDAEQLAIKTVHGYGYRLIAPVSVQTAAAELPEARFDFKPGESPPLRPLWKLTQRIGAGGHGEVWLAHHSKTGEARVFKFAEAGSALTALKREVTLNRLLRETLPDRHGYLQLLDWNFAEPPFFLESPYIASSNLAAWGDSKGGWSAVPLESRIELLAQAAAALAAAHSVGVLHKDLKPANLLVDESGGTPRIKLADFGSGGVLDTAAFEALGITRLGFTQTLHADAGTTGTPVYLAPEVIAGQPFTVQSDIYALGVMLYQLVVGDTRRSLAPGWEKGVSDELLREDIAEAAAGDPADRLGDAAALAQRLRSLGRRRQDLEQERARQEQLERAQRNRQELARLRVVAVGLFVVAVIVGAAGIVAVKARNDAQRAEETTRAVHQFLNKDLLARANPNEGATKDLTVRGLLDRASATVDERFKDQPEAAAQVHLTLGEAYWALDEVEQARSHLERAAALHSEIYGPDALKALEVRSLLAGVLKAVGKVRESCQLYAELRPMLDRKLDADDDRRLVMRAAITGCLSGISAIDEAVPELRSVIAEFERRGKTDSAWYVVALNNLALAYFDRMDFVGAEKVQRKQLEYETRRLGAGHLKTTLRRALLANSLTLTGRLDEGEAELSRAFRDQEAWFGKPPEVGILWIVQAILRLEQGRVAEAQALARQCLDSQLGRQKRGTFRLAGLYVSTESALLQGHLEAAALLARETVGLSRELGTVPVQFHELPARAQWADALVQLGQLDQARVVLEGFTPEDLAATPKQSAFYALYRRSQGLLWLREGKPDQARAALRESLEIYQLRYGPDHWRTRRAEKELAALGKT